MTPRYLLEPSRVAGAALLRAQSDERLSDMVRSGNDRAFEAIVARYKGPLLRYCSRLLQDGRGDDALQQTFLNAYDALRAGTTPLSLRSWLFGIAHNASLNILRQSQTPMELIDGHVQAIEPAHDTLERRERFREVMAAIAALPPGQRNALLLRELEGRGHEEIARELGVSGGAARQLISRARNGIRHAAAGVLPMPVLMRLTASTAPSPTADRLAELTTAGGGMTIAKVVAAAAVGSALLGGAVETQQLVRDRDQGDVAEAAVDPHLPSTRDTDVAADEASDAGRDHAGLTRRDGGRSGSDQGGAEADSGTSGSGDRSGDDADPEHEDGSNEGPGGGDGDDDPDDDNSGPGGGDDGELQQDSSGPGSGDSTETDSSGPGSGDSTETDTSGPGSGTDGGSTELDNSGSGSVIDGGSTELDNSGPG